MTGIKTTGEKKLMLFSGRAHPELAKEVAAELGVGLVPTTARDFANGEIYVRFEESVRGADCFLMQSHTAPINTWIMEQLIMIDALKRASARSISVIIPFYGYARQDKKHRGREPISARLMADMLKVAGADRIITMDLHADQVQGYFDGPVDHLFALPVLSDYIAGRTDRERLTVVSPDAGRVRVADRWADRLGAPLAIVHKRRDPNVANQVTVHEVVGNVRDRVCVLVDDMIDTAGTICAAAEALFANGAAEVIAAATHGVLSGPAPDRLKNSRVSEFIFTNSLPTPSEIALDKVTVLSMAPTIARAVREVFEDGSVTSLFEGDA
ncbi:ribose-phosphate diphosphokinase [Streptomyces sp. 7-21]|uniref:ribose-phosphate diphosphokinase n=1 Tax=Streptomyces sp. 7-21 TaxID=2802283 RepID=UPI00191F864C|nr:ribose-phosphate diphosphokinase [Streptomyces sp. 7-21]MBL1068654.1 ribose-phosphate diphosphokinase [Streptomyces sp. 7-21]